MKAAEVRKKQEIFIKTTAEEEERKKLELEKKNDIAAGKCILLFMVISLYHRYLSQC